MVLPPFCRRVTPKAGPTPINLTIHAPFKRTYSPGSALHFASRNRPLCSRRNAASSARECNGKRDCVVANPFKVFDAKQDLNAGDDIMRVLTHQRRPILRCNNEKVVCPTPNVSPRTSSKPSKEAARSWRPQSPPCGHDPDSRPQSNYRWVA
jgi:hypothetical protein